MIESALKIVKARLGITSNVRDFYLQEIIKGIVEELKAQGLSLNNDSSLHLMFVADYAAWRYQSVGDSQLSAARVTLPMPRHLQFRLHNLIINQAGGRNE
ncbi:hypothetical protein ACFQ38_02585 [Sporosarcina contaminans]|uniref:Uncharacterized protein n=1 Tax=Sporosarcina contaminans TaxID=633403 RepID=A0ABW3TTC5_9BACL